MNEEHPFELLGEKHLLRSMIERVPDVISIAEEYDVSNRFGTYILGVDQVAKVVRASAFYS